MDAVADVDIIRAKIVASHAHAPAKGTSVSYYASYVQYHFSRVIVTASGYAIATVADATHAMYFVTYNTKDDLFDEALADVFRVPLYSDCYYQTTMCAKYSETVKQRAYATSLNTSAASNSLTASDEILNIYNNWWLKY